MHHFLGMNLIVGVLVAWSVAWKCYSVWIASKNNHKKWFVALLILNTAGILDMIYVFGVAKKKWSDIERALNSLFK